jgi:flagellar biosynthetic protein FlhB
MAEEKPGNENKEFEATETRQREARQAGDVLQSREVNGLASLFGLLIGSAYLSALTAGALFRNFTDLLGRADQYAADIFTSGGVRTNRLLQEVCFSILPLFLILAALLIATLLATRSVAFSLKKIKPDFKKISPLSNVKKKYSRDGLLEFLKDSVKMFVAGLLAGLFLLGFSQDYFGSSAIAPSSMNPFAFAQIHRLLITFAVFQCALAAIDLPLQWRLRANRLKMTREEMKRESKQSEGDPHLKQARRSKGAEIARGGMLKAVETATVVMVNPEHYAVALKWDPDAQRAPVCVAKGVDHLAAKIREVANEHNVPIYRDPPSTRSMYQLVEIDEEIRPEHFAAVAAAIQYVQALQKGLPKP